MRFARVARSASALLPLLLVLTAVASAQTPTEYGAAQTAYQAPYGSTLTLNLPNGGQATPTDVLYIIQAAIRGENTSFATPAGWSGFCSLQVDPMDQEQLFYLVYPAGATPPTSITLTSGGSTWLAAIAIAYQGVNPTTPFDAPAGYCGTGAASGNATQPVPNSNPSSITAPSVTSSVSDDLVLWGFFASQDVGTSGVAVTEGKEEAEVTRQDLEAYGYMNLTDMAMPVSGSSGINTASWSPTGYGVISTGAIVMALAPAGSSPSQPPAMAPSTVTPNYGGATSPLPATPAEAPITGLNESVSPENGSVSFSLPLPVPAGRQLTPRFAIGYNSAESRAIYSVNGQLAAYNTDTGILSSDGWSYSAPMLTYNEHLQYIGSTPCIVTSGYVYQGTDGSRVPFNLSLTGWDYSAQSPTDTCDGSIPEKSQDQEGAWQAQSPAIVGNWWGLKTVTVTDPDGTQILFSGDATAGSAEVAMAMIDRNGNDIGYQLSPANALTVTDTLGRTAVATDGFAQATDHISVSGMSNPYQVTWASEPASAQASVTGAGPIPCTNTSVQMTAGTAVTSITTPQGTYTFAYDPTYGALSRITYPNGGYVRYVWGMDPQSQAAQLSQPSGNSYYTCTAYVDSLVVVDRYVSADGQTETEHQHFAYATSWNATNPLIWDSKTTTVTTSDLVAGTSFTTTYTNSSGDFGAPANALTYVGTQMPLAESVAATDISGHVISTATQSWQSSYPFQLADTLSNLNGINVSESGFGYDSLARLTQKDDYGFPGGTKTLLRETDTAYASFSDVNIYDKPASVTTRDGSLNWAAETTFGYDESAVVATSGVMAHANVTVARGNLTSVHRLLKSDGSSALTTTFVNDDTGQRVSATGPAGHTTSYSYTDNFVSGSHGTTDAYLTQATDALGNISKYAWNFDGGTMASSTDANTQTTQYGYEAWGRLAQVNSPDGGETTYTYTNSTIETKRKIDAGGDWQDQIETFDGLDRAAVTATETAAGAWSRVDTCYNGLGLASFKSYPYASASSTGAPNCAAAGDTTTFDTLGRPSQVTHSDSSTVLSSYNGGATEVQDEGNGSSRVTKVVEQDGLGHTVSVCEVTSQTDAAGNQPAGCGQDIAATGFLTSYGFDALGNTVSVTQGAESRSFVFDALSRMTQSTNPETGTWNYVYDSDSNCAAPNSSPGDLIARKDARGVITCFQYDSDHELLAKNYSDGTPAATFTYGGASQIGISNLANTVGRVSSESTADHTAVVLSYDPMGRVATEYEVTPNTWSAPATFNFASGYDLAGDLTGFGYSKGDTDSASYNLAGEPLSLASGANGNLITGVSWNAAGEETAATLGDGAAESRGYDARLRPTTINSGSYSFSVASYAPDSDVLQTTDSVNGDFTYTVDQLNRIATAACTSSPCSGASVAYSFDRYGNRWSETGTNLPGPQPPSLTFKNVHNQADGYSYDANGNLLNDGAHSYTFDAENRLVSVDAGSTATYVYNAAGLRVHEDVGGTVEEFLYGTGPQNLTLVDASQNAVETDYKFAGRNLATVNSGGSFFAGTDMLGTVRSRSNSSGTQIETDFSWPFGEFRDYGSSISRIHFTGQLEDTESGLDYFNFRYYSSDLGRFLTPDPAGESVAEPVAPGSWNAYAYVSGYPVNATDPLGLEAVDPGQPCTPNGDGTFDCGSATGHACRWWQIWCWSGGGSSVGGDDGPDWGPGGPSFQNPILDGGTGPEGPGGGSGDPWELGPLGPGGPNEATTAEPRQNDCSMLGKVAETFHDIEATTAPIEVIGFATITAGISAAAIAGACGTPEPGEPLACAGAVVGLAPAFGASVAAAWLMTKNLGTYYSKLSTDERAYKCGGQ